MFRGSLNLRVLAFTNPTSLILSERNELRQKVTRDGIRWKLTTWLIPLKSPLQLSFFPSFPEGCHPDFVTLFTFSMPGSLMQLSKGVTQGGEA